MANNPAAQPVAKKKGSSRIPLTYVVALVPVAAALNIVGGQINTILKLPTFLDMIGTAVVAIVLGPWWGALVGAITNIVASFISGPIGLPFAVVNVAGALVWGYGVRNLMMGKTFTRYFILNLVVALICTLFAVPIYVFIFGGATGHFSDMMTAAFLAAGQNLITSVFSSNIIVSLADKVISGFVALAIIEALPKNLTSKLVLPVSTTMNKVLWILGGVLVGVAFALAYLALQPK
jgi:energy-coupling factor transport system substrate-specific component